ncbi:MAG: leucyl/phenylalanyl-tRNA--protein transferase [Candidatus Binatia bacterium]|nr:leucyl/phenylalanyl-tRNA--protein transferase [Candidatus Binatia bacterium]
MPIYRLTTELVFPHPEWATPTGLLAIGGDLSPARLLLAYRSGIFPWYEAGDPILWWSPPRRCIMDPAHFHVSRSLRRLLRQARFTVTFDAAFPQVIEACAQSRLVQQQGTWITPEMIDAYCTLHDLGFAHSAEAWREGRLVGGIYGVSLGRAFFGESMFKYEPNASKVAFATLARQLAEWQFTLIDCQITNPHLLRLGAYEVPRRQFLRQLARALEFPTRQGKWSREATRHVSCPPPDMPSSEQS